MMEVKTVICIAKAACILCQMSILKLDHGIIVLL